MAECADEALLERRGDTHRAEIPQCPDNDAGHEDDAAHLLQVLLTFLPRVSPDGLGCWPAVGRQFHDKRCVLALNDER